MMTVEQAKEAMRNGHAVLADTHVAMAASHALRVEAERKVALLNVVLFQQALQHPLPWSIESDWTEEVRASDGYCIAKCRTTEDAEALIALAVAAYEASRSDEER